MMRQISISPMKDLIFDSKVREMCRSCKRYGKKATCPPYVESVGYYQKLLIRYKNGILFFKAYPIDDEDAYEKLSKESSLEMRRKILSERNELFAEGHYFVLGLGAGSCKLCDECSFPCRMPGEALIPLEATGINVVGLLNKFKIKIKFPVKENFYRVGALFYD